MASRRDRRADLTILEAGSVLRSLRYLLIVLCAWSLSAHGADDLLDPDDAFRFSARMAGADMVEVSYRVADGYYLYKDRFAFAAAPDTLLLGAPQFPQASWHEDEFFGRAEVFRGSVTVRIPLSGVTDGKGFRLTVVSQGCADIGVCYLPGTHVADLLRLESGSSGSSRP